MRRANGLAKIAAVRRRSGWPARGSRREPAAAAAPAARSVFELPAVRRRRRGAAQPVCRLPASLSERRRILAFFEQDGDRLVDLDPLGALGNDDLAEPAFVDRLVFHRRLVGLDLGDDVAGMDLVAFFLEPAREVPSVIVGDSAGIRIWIGMILSPFVGPCDDAA